MTHNYCHVESSAETTDYRHVKRPADGDCLMLGSSFWQRLLRLVIIELCTFTMQAISTQDVHQVQFSYNSVSVTTDKL